MTSRAPLARPQVPAPTYDASSAAPARDAREPGGALLPAGVVVVAQRPARQAVDHVNARRRRRVPAARTARLHEEVLVHRRLASPWCGVRPAGGPPDGRQAAASAPVSICVQQGVQLLGGQVAVELAVELDHGRDRASAQAGHADDGEAAVGRVAVGAQLQAPLQVPCELEALLHVAGRAAAQLDDVLAQRREAELVVERGHAVHAAHRRVQRLGHQRHGLGRDEPLGLLDLLQKRDQVVAVQAGPRAPRSRPRRESPAPPRRRPRLRGWRRLDRRHVTPPRPPRAPPRAARRWRRRARPA